MKQEPKTYCGIIPDHPTSTVITKDTMKTIEKSDKPQFYYKGYVFDTEKEFFDYVKKWPDQIIDSSEFNQMFDLFKKDIWMNIKLNGIDQSLTNGAASEIIQELFLISFEMFTKIE